MSPIDAAIVRRKLGHIMTALDGLRPLARLSVNEYRARLYERKAAERLLRNRRVHEYDAIDDAKVLGAIATTLDSYPRYIRAVEAYLGKAGL